MLIVLIPVRRRLIKVSTSWSLLSSCVYALILLTNLSWRSLTSHLPLLKHHPVLFVLALDFLELKLELMLLDLHLLVSVSESSNLTTSHMHSTLDPIPLRSKAVARGLPHHEVPAKLAVHLLDFFLHDLQFVLLEFQHVDLLNQLHILIEHSLVPLVVLASVLIQLVFKSLHTVLQLLALIGVFVQWISLASVELFLLEDPGPVKSDDSLLQLFEIVLILAVGRVEILLKAALHFLLLVDGLLKLGRLLGESLLSHAEIVDDEHQVLVYAVELLLLGSHLIGLLIKLLNLHIFRADVSLELLDLVVEHELELL